MTPQQHQQHLNEIGQYYQQQKNNRQSRNQGPSDAEIRAWHARERKIQAEIAQLRATPFYQAIAYDFANNLLLGGGVLH